MPTQYLKTKIEERYATITPNHGRTIDGYSAQSGAPTSWMIRLAGEKRWRRLMVWQFSNAGTLFVKVAGECLIVCEHDLPAEARAHA